MPDPTDSELKAQREAQAKSNAAARAADPSAMGVTSGPGTYEYDKKLREEQANRDAVARSQDASAVGNIEVAGRNRGLSPEDTPGTWQNQQREIARFNEAEAQARSRDPGAMGRTDAGERAGASRQTAQPRQQQSAQSTRILPPIHQPPPRPASGRPAGTAHIASLKVPEKGFTRMERDWIKTVLIPAIMTVRGVPGRNVSITDGHANQVINASDCQSCP